MKIDQKAKKGVIFSIFVPNISSHRCDHAQQTVTPMLQTVTPMKVANHRCATLQHRCDRVEHRCDRLQLVIFGQKLHKNPSGGTFFGFFSEILIF